MEYKMHFCQLNSDIFESDLAFTLKCKNIIETYLSRSKHFDILNVSITHRANLMESIFSVFISKIDELKFFIESTNDEIVLYLHTSKFVQTSKHIFLTKKLFALNELSKNKISLNLVKISSFVKKAKEINAKIIDEFIKIINDIHSQLLSELNVLSNNELNNYELGASGTDDSSDEFVKLSTSESPNNVQTDNVQTNLIDLNIDYSKIQKEIDDFCIVSDNLFFRINS